MEGINYRSQQCRPSSVTRKHLWQWPPMLMPSERLDIYMLHHTFEFQNNFLSFFQHFCRHDDGREMYFGVWFLVVGCNCTSYMMWDMKNASCGHWSGGTIRLYGVTVIRSMVAGLLDHELDYHMRHFPIVDSIFYMMHIWGMTNRNSSIGESTCWNMEIMTDHEGYKIDYDDKEYKSGTEMRTLINEIKKC